MLMILGIGRKFNVHKTFRSLPGRLLNVLSAFDLRPVSMGYEFDWKGEDTFFNVLCKSTYMYLYWELCFKIAEGVLKNNGRCYLKLLRSEY